MKNFALLLFSASAMAMLMSCSSSTNVAVSGVSLDPSELTLLANGQPAKLVATVNPPYALDRSVSWSSDNSAVATVSEDGVVTPVAAGNAKITVTTKDGGKTAGCDVTVVQADTTAPGEVTNLHAESNGDDSVTLSWDDPSDADLFRIEITYLPGGSSVPIQAPKGVQKQVISGLTDKTEYTITIRTVDNRFNKSTGAHINITVNDTKAPAEVGSAAAIVSSGASIQVTWTDPADLDFAKVELTYTTGPEAIFVQKGVAKYQLNNLLIDKTYTVNLVTIDRNENRSNGVSITVPMPDANGLRGCALATSSNISSPSFVKVPDLAIPNNFTIETWIKALDTTHEQMILTKQQAAVQPNQFRLAIDSGNVYFMMSGQDQLHLGSLWSESSNYAVSAPIATDQWTHIAITKKDSEFNLYMNGTLATTYTDPMTPLIHMGTSMFELAANIAKDGISSERYFDGFIDEVRMWDIPRDAGSISADMGKAIPSTHSQYSHLVAYYKFNECSGAVSADIVGNHPAYLVNTPSWVDSTIPIQ